jgi:hypothetical protein
LNPDQLLPGPPDIPNDPGFHPPESPTDPDFPLPGQPGVPDDPGFNPPEIPGFPTPQFPDDPGFTPGGGAPPPEPDPQGPSLPGLYEDQAGPAQPDFTDTSGGDGYDTSGGGFDASDDAL